MEKILQDVLLKISVVISDLFAASGRRFLDALVAGERSPKALAVLGDTRLKASRQELQPGVGHGVGSSPTVPTRSPPHRGGRSRHPYRVVARTDVLVGGVWRLSSTPWRRRRCCSGSDRWRNRRPRHR